MPHPLLLTDIEDTDIEDTDIEDDYSELSYVTSITAIVFPATLWKQPVFW